MAKNDSQKQSILLVKQAESFFINGAAPDYSNRMPKGEDPGEHYRRIFAFEKNHFSPRTMYNVFWAANNCSMPDPVPAADTKIEYWYGEEEKKAGKQDIAYACRAYPQTAVKEFKGLAHAELVLMFPERFYKEATRFLKTDRERTDNRYVTSR